MSMRWANRPLCPHPAESATECSFDEQYSTLDESGAFERRLRALRRCSFKHSFGREWIVRHVFHHVHT